MITTIQQYQNRTIISSLNRPKQPDSRDISNRDKIDNIREQVLANPVNINNQQKPDLGNLKTRRKNLLARKRCLSFIMLLAVISLIAITFLFGKSLILAGCAGGLLFFGLAFAFNQWQLKQIGRQIRTLKEQNTPDRPRSGRSSYFKNKQHAQKEQMQPQNASAVEVRQPPCPIMQSTMDQFSQPQWSSHDFLWEVIKSYCQLFVAPDCNLNTIEDIKKAVRWIPCEAGGKEGLVLEMISKGIFNCPPSRLSQICEALGLSEEKVQDLLYKTHKQNPIPSFSSMIDQLETQGFFREKNKKATYSALYSQFGLSEETVDLYRYCHRSDLLI